MGHSAAHPYRPINHVNYTTDSSGLNDHCPAPAWRDRQPFLHTIAGMPLYEERLDVVRKHQERFVLKMLSHSHARLDMDTIASMCGEPPGAQTANQGEAR